MECIFARFRYGPTIQTVALYSGIPHEELSNILLTILPVSGKIIGLQDENGAIVPLTLACRLPNILTGCLSVILAADPGNGGATAGTAAGATTAPPITSAPSSTIDTKSNSHVESLLPSAPPLTVEDENNVEETISPHMEANFGAAPPPLQPSTDPEYDNVLSADDLQQADNTLDELLRFIAGLRVQRVIKKQEADALEELLFNNSSLIFAAYSVAKSAGDAEYLTEVCKDIAQSMMSTAGQSACAAQEDVLQCCDRLYIDSKITDNQLLYLRHLVLIRDEDVAQMYDEFRENFDVTRLMIGLLRLANLQSKVKEETSKDVVPPSNNPEHFQHAIKKQQGEIANSYKEQKRKSNTQSKKEESKNRSKKDSNPYRKRGSNKSTSSSSQTDAPSNTSTPAPPIPPPPSASSSASAAQVNTINQTIMLNTLNGIIALMIRSGDITPVEAALLNHMITSQNEFIYAAYEIFQSDGKVVELQDTLTRCAKIELKKRGLVQEKRVNKPKTSSATTTATTSTTRTKSSSAAAPTTKSTATSTTKSSNTKPNKQSGSAQRNQRSRPASHPNVSEADDEDSPTSSDENSQPIIDTKSDNRAADGEDNDDDFEAPPSCDSPSQLSRLLSSLNVTNIWQNTVPTKFVYTVFSATQKRLLSIGQCRALCDLFQAQYDLVRAAWEVYNVQDDTFDFIDTLKRIVRDLTFQEDGNVNMSLSNEDEDVNNDEDNDDDDNYNNYNNQDETKVDIVQVMKETEVRAKEAREAKSNALAAVTEAKRELLKHSLEIMVKQGLVTAQAASNLYERALKGDPLTDAAIEGYAGDRNIMEFLDTLQILANNTPEDLEKMLRSAINSNEGENAAEDEDEVQEYTPNETADLEDEIDDDEEDEISLDLDFDEVQRELKSFAKEMLSRGEIDPDNYASLLDLIKQKDDRVLAAHDVYRDLQDKADLFDSLLRISRKHHLERQPSDDGGIEMSQLSKAKEDEDVNEVEMTQLKSNTRSRKSADESGVELSNFQGRKPQENQPQRPQSPPGVLTSDDQKSILVILINAGVVTDAQANQIITLIDNGSREIQLIFKQYEQHRDVHTLIDSLRLASSAAEEVDENDDDDDDYNNNNNNNEDDDEDDDEDGEDFDSTQRVGEMDLAEEDESELDEEEKDTVEMKFLNIIQGMSLSNLETAALRLAIARDDPTIRFALESFRINRNEDVLMEALREVARHTIHEALNEAGYDGVEDDSPNPRQENNDNDDGNNDNEVADEVEDEENEEEEEEAAEVEEEEEENGEDDDENDDDEDDFDESQQSQSNMMMSKAARIHIFPILISELLKENVLSSSDSKKLLELFQKDDDVINAALDVYDLDSDLSELVDTLQRIVRTSSSSG